MLLFKSTLVTERLDEQWRHLLAQDCIICLLSSLLKNLGMAGTGFSCETAGPNPTSFEFTITTPALYVVGLIV
jgi:hypothetical protein